MVLYLFANLLVGIITSCANKLTLHYQGQFPYFLRPSGARAMRLRVGSIFLPTPYVSDCPFLCIASSGLNYRGLHPRSHPRTNDFSMCCVFYYVIEIMYRSPHCRRVSPLTFFHILDSSLDEYFWSSKSDVYSMYPTPGRLGFAEEMKQVRQRHSNRQCRRPGRHTLGMQNSIVDGNLRSPMT